MIDPTDDNACAHPVPVCQQCGDEGLDEADLDDENGWCRSCRHAARELWRWSQDAKQGIDYIYAAREVTRKAREGWWTRWREQKALQASSEGA